MVLARVVNDRDAGNAAALAPAADRSETMMATASAAPGAGNGTMDSLRLSSNRYGYWIASCEENAAVDISLPGRSQK